MSNFQTGKDPGTSSRDEIVPAASVEPPPESHEIPLEKATEPKRIVLDDNPTVVISQQVPPRMDSSSRTSSKKKHGFVPFKHDDSLHEPEDGHEPELRTRSSVLDTFANAFNIFGPETGGGEDPGHNLADREAAGIDTQKYQGLFSEARIVYYQKMFELHDRKDHGFLNEDELKALLEDINEPTWLGDYVMQRFLERNQEQAKAAEDVAASASNFELSQGIADSGHANQDFERSKSKGENKSRGISLRKKRKGRRDLTNIAAPRIDFDSFLQLMSFGYFEQFEDLIAAFHVLDFDQSGTLDRGEWRRIVCGSAVILETAKEGSTSPPPGEAHPGDVEGEIHPVIDEEAQVDPPNANGTRGIRSRLHRRERLGRHTAVGYNYQATDGLTLEQADEVFDILDVDQSGSISVREIIEMFQDNVPIQYRSSTIA